VTPPAEPTPNQQSIGELLAAFLSDRREQIISDCITSVERDEKLKASDTLNPSQLRDHLPQLLDNLSKTLCDAFSKDLKDQAAWTAATHGHIRWEERYDVSQLLREFAHLRSSLIHYLVEFQAHNESTGSSWLFAATVVHRFLDDAVRISVEELLATDKRSKREPNVA